MGQFKLKIEELAEKHLKQHLKSGDKASIKKIEKILVELTERPFSGIGNPDDYVTNFRVFGRVVLTKKIALSIKLMKMW